MTQAKKEFVTTMRINIAPDAAHEVTKQSAPRRVPRVKKPDAAQPASERVESRYEALIESIYDAVLIADLNGQILQANPRATEFLSCTRAELCGHNVVAFISGADLPLVQSLLPDLDNQRFVLIKAYCIRKDRTIFPSEIAVSLMGTDEKQLCFFIRDITLREQTEALLRTQSNAIEHSGNGIAITDLAGRLTYANPAMVQLWRYDQPSDLSGLDARQLWVDARSADEIIETVLQKQETWAGELVARRKDGTTFNVQVSAGRNRDNEGHTVGLVFSYVDISERTEAFTRLRELNEAKSQFVSEAAHELRTPLAIIGEFVSLVQEETLGPLNGKQKECLQSAKRNNDRLAELVNKMLDLARIESRKTELHLGQSDVARLLKQCHGDFLSICRSKNQALLLDVPERVAAAYCDLNSVHNVIVNLVGNAQKFTPAGGAITLSCRQEGRFLRVAVADTGCGIPPEAQEKIFEAFIRVDREAGCGPKGTGLGLAITKQLVTLNGGRISVNSVPGQGSRFCFTLPVYEEEAPARVLVVDDEESVVTTIAYILQKADLNLELKSSLSGRESLAIAAGFKPRLVLLDMGLADIVADRILPSLKRQTPDGACAVLVMSDEDMAVDELRKQGADDFLRKPFLPNELIRKVKLLLGADKAPAPNL